MNKPDFSTVKVLIWDFDGTLYKPHKELWGEIRESEYRVIMNHTGWDHDRAVREFEKVYKVATPSATQAVATIASITTTQAALEMESLYDRRKFVDADPKLIHLFETLRSYTHYILGNGIRQKLEETLVRMGIDKNIFAQIVTSEVSGENKPSPKGFEYIMNKTGLEAAAHLMIGDRESVDLAPAKALGFKTCLVWASQESAIADVTLSTVYDVSSLFE